MKFTNVSFLHLSDSAGDELLIKVKMMKIRYEWEKYKFLKMTILKVDRLFFAL